MRSKSLEWPFLALIALLAPFLGGSTARWTQGIVLFLFGLLLVIRPPRRSLGLGINLVIGAFLALALTAFAPASWFSMPDWRSHGAPAVALALPSTLTPQPWLTAEAIVLMIAGIAWLYFLCESQACSNDLAPALKAFCVGIALFAGISEYLFFKGMKWPFENAVAHFGPFPNKNQAGHVLAVGSIVVIACIYDAIRRRSKSVLWWLACAGVILFGLVLSFSRGAILAFLAGLVFWLVCIVVLTRSRSWGVFGIATVSLLLAGFFVFGGKTLDHLRDTLTSETEISSDLRWTIQKDALTMALESPLPGSGVGNFHNVFQQFHRALGTFDINIVHPESDWYWLLDEMGWIGLGLAIFGVVLFFRRALPFAQEPENWHWRAAGCAAGLMLVIHGLIDVAGHRVGSVFAALFVFSFAMRRDARVKRNRWIPWVFRVCGILLAGTGAAWTVATRTQTLFPGTIGVTLVKKIAPRLNEQNEDTKYQQVIDLTTKAMEWAPMDWELYYDRAVAEAYMDKAQIEAAKADFLRACFLQPTTGQLPLNEGIVWLPVNPALALPAWKEALRRAPQSREKSYEQMLAASALYPDAHGILRQLAGGDLNLQLAFLSRAPQQEAAEGIQKLIAADPDLRAFSPVQKKVLFALWAKNGDRSALVEQLEKHEDWLALGWPAVVQLHLSENDAERAYEIAHRFAKLPAVPQIAAGTASAADLARRWYSNPEDFAAALVLFEQYQKSGAADDALAVLQKVTALKNCPAYFHRLKAEALASRHDWPQACEALRKSLPGQSLAQE